MNQATMKKSPTVQVEAPRIENGKALRIAGLKEHYTSETMKNMPELWLRFGVTGRLSTMFAATSASFT